MKIAVYSDAHWSQYSSIVRARGEKYSARLENLIQSVSWVEQTAKQYDCKLIVCGGDFFDSELLKAEEISALKEVQWSNIAKVFLVGNHEMGLNNLQFNSCDVFSLIDNAQVVYDPMQVTVDNADVLFLPYILNDARKPLSEYITKHDGRKLLILSHNDIAGIQLGKFVSVDGFTIQEILQNCDLFVNGHLHNGSWIDLGRIINIGNITGQNFNEDATIYRHNMAIIDTDYMSCMLIENPYAYNFYKLEDSNISSLLSKLKKMNDHCVATIKCRPENYKQIKEIVDNNNIISRILIDTPQIVDDAEKEEIQTVNHLQAFHDYIYQSLGKSSVVDEELQEVLL